LTGGKASRSDGSRHHAHHHGYCRKTPAKPEKLAKDFTPEEHRVEAEKHATAKLEEEHLKANGRIIAQHAEANGELLAQKAAQHAIRNDEA
jgi:hypothetical protein